MIVISVHVGLEKKAPVQWSDSNHTFQLAALPLPFGALQRTQLAHPVGECCPHMPTVSSIQWEDWSHCLQPPHPLPDP